MRSFKFISILAVVYSMLLVSCVDKISIPETLDPAKINIECELVPPHQVTARVSTSGDLAGKYTPQFPKDAKVRLLSEIDEEFEFTYNEEKNLYECTYGRLREGFKYQLTASVKSLDHEVIPIKALTTIPKKSSLENVEIINVEEISEDQYQNAKQFVTTVQFKFSKSSNPTYSVLQLGYRTGTYLIDNGSKSMKLSEKISDTSVKSILEGGTAIHEMSHKQGILIDHSRLEDDSFVIQISANKPILGSDLKLYNVHTKLCSVTEDFYRYHLAMSKQFSIGDNNLIEPVINYSNIENGYGVLGAMSNVAVDSILVEK